MSNDFYTRSSNPAPGSSLRSDLIRAEFASLESAFNKMPRITGYANYYVAVNAGGTALVPVLAPSGTLPTQTGQAYKFLTTDGSNASWKTLYRDWVTKTSNYTAANGDRLRCNTSGGAFTVTLPASPADGDQIWIMDYSGSFATNNLTVGRNGKTIVGSATDLVIDTNNFACSLVYILASGDWRFG